MDEIVNSHTRLPQFMMANFAHTEYKSKRNLELYYIKYYLPILYNHQIRYVGTFPGYYRKWEETALTRCYEASMASLCRKIVKGSLWRLSQEQISTLVHYVIFSIARAIPHGVYRFLKYAELVMEPPIDPCISYDTRIVVNATELEFVGSECGWGFVSTKFCDKALFIPVSPKYGIFLYPSERDGGHSSRRPVTIKNIEFVDIINHSLMDYNYAYGGHMIISRNKKLLYSYMEYMLRLGKEGTRMLYDEPTVCGIVPATSLVLDNVDLKDDSNPRIDYAIAILCGNFPASKLYFNPEGTTWTHKEHDMYLEVTQ